MSRQAQLGLFAVAALVLLFGMFYVITDFGTRHSGYRFGVHFASSAGLPTGAQVFFSGVSVGTVDRIDLLPDDTVEVVLALQRNVKIPVGAKFLIQAPVTGTPNLFIIPPVPRNLRGVNPAAVAPAQTWPQHVLPLAEQPVGTPPRSLADFMTEGEREFKRMDSMVALLQRREPVLLSRMGSAMKNLDDLTFELKGSVAQISANFVGMSGTLQSTVARNQYKIDTMLSSLDQTALALSQTMTSLQRLAGDKQLKGNILATTANVRDITGNLAGVTSNLAQLTGNPQTQAQLRDTVSHLDATMQKANSLLGTLGGRSSVYGVDAGATPYPVPSGRYSVPPAPSVPQPGSTANPQALRQGLAHAVRNLFAIQLRLSYLNRQMVSGPDPLLTADRGPQADLNALALPHGSTSFLAGINDVGANTTWNAAAIKNFGGGFHAGGGVLYSQIGALASFDTGKFGAQTRIYDLRRPTIDLYGNLDINRWTSLFLGERDTTRSDRRTVMGLQLQF